MSLRSWRLLAVVVLSSLAPLCMTGCGPAPADVAPEPLPVDQKTYEEQMKKEMSKQGY